MQPPASRYLPTYTCTNSRGKTKKQATQQLNLPTYLEPATMLQAWMKIHRMFLTWITTDERRVLCQWISTITIQVGSILCFDNICPSCGQLDETTEQPIAIT